jgi:hypothetical protein
MMKQKQYKLNVISCATWAAAAAAYIPTAAASLLLLSSLNMCSYSCSYNPNSTADQANI